MLLSYLNGWQKRLKNIGMLSNAGYYKIYYIGSFLLGTYLM